MKPYCERYKLFVIIYLIIIDFYLPERLIPEMFDLHIT